MPSVSPRRTLLSLFDGTGSICKPFVDNGWLVRRLDVDGRHGADIVVDILDWDPSKDWSGPPPDVIFAGPPCEQYSMARSTAKTPRNLTLADSLVAKTTEIIDYFHKRNRSLQYFVENPDSSMVWKRWVSHRLYHDVGKHPKSVTAAMLRKNRKVSQWKLTANVAKVSRGDKHVMRLDYCQYKAKYRKRTRLMTNNPFAGLMCNGRCASMVGGRHVEVAQRGPRAHTKASPGAPGKRYHTRDQLHAYPADLVEVIFRHVDSSPSRTRDGVHKAKAEPKWDTVNGR